MEGWLSPEGEFLEEVDSIVGLSLRPLEGDGPVIQAMRERLIKARDALVESRALSAGYAKLTLEDGILVAKGGKRSIVKQFAEEKGLWYRHDKS